MGRERLDIFSTPTIFLSVAGETCGAGATRALRRGFLAEKYGLEGQHTRREPTCRQYAARRARRLYRDTPSLWYDVGTAAPRDELKVARFSESALASRVARLALGLEPEHRILCRLGGTPNNLFLRLETLQQ